MVVIESMKMETVIRSPMDGVIKKIVHWKGVSGNSDPGEKSIANIIGRICARLVRRLSSLRARKRRRLRNRLLAYVKVK